MDCYIVRIYRRTASKGGQGSEIAGLVEKVGDVHDSKAFNSCQSLVNMLRGGQLQAEPLRPSKARTASGTVVSIVPDASAS